jgi:hypothetical protein
MEGRMANNERTGVEACLTDPQFRATLQNRSTDEAWVSGELDRIGIVFVNDFDGSKRKAVLDLIAKTDWSKLSEALEAALNNADGTLHPLMG